MQLDPMAEANHTLSPYSFPSNSPLTVSDPTGADGKCPDCAGDEIELNTVTVTAARVKTNNILDLKEKVSNLEGLRSFHQQRANIEAVQQQNAINYMRGDLMKVWEFDMQLVGAAEFGVGVSELYKVGRVPLARLAKAAASQFIQEEGLAIYTWQAYKAVFSMRNAAIDAAEAVAERAAVATESMPAVRLPEVIADVGQTPVVGGGAQIAYLGREASRIQSIATKYNLKITVVGSRVNGKANSLSDWDYIITGGTSKARSSALYQLPRNLNAVKDGAIRSGSEMLKGVALDNNLPYIIFNP